MSSFQWQSVIDSHVLLNCFYAVFHALQVGHVNHLVRWIPFMLFLYFTSAVSVSFEHVLHISL